MKEKMELIGAGLIVAVAIIILAAGYIRTDAEAHVYKAWPIETRNKVNDGPKEEAKVDVEEEEMDFLWSDDRLLIAKVVQAEAGNETFVGMVAVASTILNRAELREMTIEEVVYEKNQYATPWIGTIDTQVFDAVDFAFENRDLFPKNMFFFRTTYYHRMPFADEYVQIGRHFFSTDNRYEQEVKK